MSNRAYSLPLIALVFASQAIALLLAICNFVFAPYVVQTTAKHIDLKLAVLAPGIISAAGLLFFVATAFHVFKWFSSSGKSPVAGLAILTWAACFALVAAATASAFNLRDDYRDHLNAIAEMGQAEVSFQDGVLTITGPIGDRLLNLVQTYDTPSGAVREIQINSEGGFVSDALDLAEFVESHSIKVVVMEYCYSACVLVAVASPKSFAKADSYFGFHKTYSAYQAHTQFVRAGVKEWGKDSDEFLMKHGVPQNIVEEASKMGPDELYFMSAQEAADAKFIDGVIEGE